MKTKIILVVLMSIMLPFNVIFAQCSFSISSTNVRCYGFSDGTATATLLTGVAPFHFVWSTSPSQNTSTAINLAADTYTVTVTDSIGCIRIDSITITQPDLLIVQIVAPDTICLGSSGIITANIAGGTPPIVYTLIPASIIGPPNPPYTVSPTSTTTYRLNIIDFNGCTATDTTTIYVAPCLGVNSNESSNLLLEIFPNPTSDKFTITCPKEPLMQLCVYDMIGKEILRKEIGSAATIDVSALPQGVYLITVTGKDWIAQKKLIKQ